MKPLLELHLRDEPEKAKAPDLPKQEVEESMPLAPSKKLNRMARRAAHRAAVDAGRSSSGLFSK
ncbi:MAG: hypothetical protein KGM96_05610 [Acidobacteriota bacterium]|nr:hypothetical protein [Acidobacteriota bacterium]